MASLRYGAFVQPGMISAAKGEGHQFGMYASVQGGTQALLRHSRAESTLFVCSPLGRDGLARDLASLGRSNYTLETLGEFLQRGGSGDVNAWLDLGGDAVRPHRFRRRVGGDYPIGIGQHSVSYGYALHSWFLPLLLGDVRACDTVLCTSSAARESIRKILDGLASDFNREFGAGVQYRGRLDVVPAGVDTDHFHPIPQHKARQVFKIQDGEVVLLWAGRISAQDKADLIPFLRVFRDLVQGIPQSSCCPRPNLRLVLAGAARGDEMQVIAKAATELGVMNRVTALGLVPHALLPALYSSADVFVSPADSLPETFGLTVVEAMACGVPVVASNWDGYKDTVVHEETGFLVDVTLGDLSLADDFSEWSLPQGELLDVFAAAQATIVHMGRPMELTGRDPGVRSVYGALECLLNNPSQRFQMGQAGRRRAVDKYDWRVVVRMHDDLFEELQELPRQSRRCERPYSRTNLAEAFSHYGTGVLGPETVVQARSGLHGEPLVVQDPRKHYCTLSESLANSILDLIRRDGAETVESITHADFGDEVASEQEIRRHVAWLLKYGYLEVVS